MCVWWCEPTQNEHSHSPRHLSHPSNQACASKPAESKKAPKGGTVLSGVRPSGVKVFSMRVIFTVALVCLAAGHLFFYSTYMNMVVAPMWAGGDG
jgi:hypothetical protein